MATREDIISWGRVNGWDIPEDATRLPSGLRSAYDETTGGEDGVTAPPAEGDENTAERAPVIKRETVAERARSLVGTARKVAPKKSTRAKSKKPRVAVSRLVSRGWEGLARLVANVNYPVSRVLQVQAPVAGALLEDVIKDTIVDKALQPLARAGEGGELMFALAGPPMIVAALTTPQGQRPEMQAFLVPALKEALRSWIDVAGPRLKELEERDKQFQEQYGDQIDSMIASFFAPQEGAPYHPDENPNAV